MTVDIEHLIKAKRRSEAFTADKINYINSNIFQAVNLKCPYFTNRPTTTFITNLNSKVLNIPIGGFAEPMIPDRLLNTENIENTCENIASKYSLRTCNNIHIEDIISPQQKRIAHYN